jgi:hypothetical protein
MYIAGFDTAGHNPTRLAQKKCFDNATTKFGSGVGREAGGGMVVATVVTEDIETLETGFCLDVWDPIFGLLLSGEL